jgi:hypothetical protein
MTLKRPENLSFYLKVYNDNKDKYYLFSLADSRWSRFFEMSKPENKIPNYFATVVPIDARFQFVIGGNKGSVFIGDASSE